MADAQPVQPLEVNSGETNVKVDVESKGGESATPATAEVVKSSKPAQVIPMGLTQSASDAELSGEDKMANIKKAVDKFLNNNYVVTFMMVLTFWALFSNDIRVSGAPKESDDAFAGIATMAFFLFVLEIALTSFANPEYIDLPKWEAKPGETTFETWTRRMVFGGFYFWLDWLSTLTLLFEIPWALGDAVSGSSGVQSANAVRLVRLVRMVRLVRLVKLYKYAQQAKELQKKRAAKEERRKAGEIVADDDDLIIEESHVGAAMADITNKRVLILILVMLIIVPLLTVSETDSAQHDACQIIHLLAADPQVSTVSR